MEPLQRAIADACLGADTGEDIARDLPGFLAARGVAPDDIETLVAAPRRLAIYRSLVRNGLSSVVLRMLPRTRARMNAACTGGFDADFARFVDEVGPRTHYLRDVPAEFFGWAEPRWRASPHVPAYLPDLAALELTQFAVAAAECARSMGHSSEIALDRPLAFLGSARIARYEWAVHELSVDESSTHEPERRDVCLLAYRDAAHAVHWLDLTPLAAAILERLLAREPLGVAVQNACRERAIPSAPVLDDVARLLADLGLRGVLL